MYSAHAASSAGVNPTHSFMGVPLPAAKNFPAFGSRSPVAESIFPRSTPRSRFAARSNISSTSVLIMAAHPLLPSIALVAAFRDQVEVVVGGVDQIDSTRVGRGRVVDPPVVPGEDAEPFPVGDA